MKLLMALLFFSSTALAQDMITCKYDGSQIEMNACALWDYTAADSALNQEYDKAMERLDVDGQKKLRDAQREWIKRRDARCKPKRVGNGSNSTIDYFTCMQTFTEIRTLQLKAMP